MGVHLRQRDSRRRQPRLCALGPLLMLALHQQRRRYAQRLQGELFVLLAVRLHLSLADWRSALAIAARRPSSSVVRKRRPSSVLAITLDKRRPMARPPAVNHIVRLLVWKSLRDFSMARARLLLDCV